MSKRDSLALVLSYTYPPDPSVSSPRISHLVETLTARGYHVVVVTAAEPRGGEPGDVIHISDPVTLIRIWLSKHWNADETGGSGTDSNPDAQARVRHRGFFKIRHKVIPNIGLLDRQTVWAWKVRFLARRRVKATTSPLFILASAPPFSLLGAARRLGKAWNAPVVIDLRDLWLPPIDSPNPISTRWRALVHSSMRRRCCGVAFVTTVSGNLQRQIRDSLGLSSSIVENGVSAPEWEGSRGIFFDSDASLVYTGKLYPEYESHLLTLLRSLAHQEANQGWVLHYFGPDYGYLDNLARSVGAQSHIKGHGSVDTAASHNAQLGATALLLLSGGPEGPITTKIYDYLASGRPILCVGSQENDAADLLKRRARSCWLCTSGADVDHALTSLSSQTSPATGPQFPTEILRDFQSKRWVALIEDVVGEEEGSAWPYE